MSKSVLVTRRIPEIGIRILNKAGYDVEVHAEDRPMRYEELMHAVEGKDGILCLLTDRIDGSILHKAGETVGIANYAVGYENIDIEKATRLGIMVTNTPGVLTETTADLAWALVMTAARRIVEGDALVRSNGFRGWAPMLLLGSDVYGKTLGIVGSGRIGCAVARRAIGFEMPILYYSRHTCPEIESIGGRAVSLSELLSRSDYVSLHVSLNPESFHLIDGDRLKEMKSSAILINTSRGPVVDEEALVNALSSGNISAAALDVFENEPDIHPGLFNLPNVILAPHIGSASRETREKMAITAAGNLHSMLSGRRPPDLVNEAVLSHPRCTNITTS